MKNLNLLKWVLIISTIIVLNLFFNVATRLVYPEPEYNKYCVQKQDNTLPNNKAACLAIGGSWNGNDYPSKVPAPVIDLEARPVQPAGYCDADFTCRKTYEDAHKIYNRNVFVVMVVLGLLSIIVGFVFSQISAVSLGLSFGGVIALVIGSIRYWSDMQEYLRLIILALALITLIWLGVKKIKE